MRFEEARDEVPKDEEDNEGHECTTENNESSVEMKDDLGYLSEFTDERLDCNCIVTRGGVYNEILPEPEGFSEGSGNFSSYPLTHATIQSFSITSTGQYFLVLTP